MDLKNGYVEGSKITPQNIRFYEEAGYLVAPGLLNAAEVADLRAETIAIFRGARGQIDGLLPGSEQEKDTDILKKYTAIHFPHKLSAVISTYLFHNKILEVLTGIVSSNVKCMQSMLFVKGPGKAGQSWHQDEFYIPTRDRSLVGAWIAIDDAGIDNGCLWIIPGSHRPSYIRRRVKNSSNEYADVDTIDVSAFRQDDMVPVELKSGSVVFFNGYTLHSSLRNKTNNCFRTALVNHYMSAESMLPWDQDGNLPPTDDLRDVVLVAGEDPYRYKGTVDVNKPYLRPDVLNIKSKI